MSVAVSGIDGESRAFDAVERATSPIPPLLLLSGVALGPHGLAVLTPRILVYLDPVAPVALATIGAMVGLGVSADWHHASRQTLMAHGHTLFTAVLVAAGIIATGSSGWVAEAFPQWRMVVMVLAISAATSSLPHAEQDQAGGPSDPGAREALIPVLIGGVLMAAFREPTVTRALSVASQAAAIAAVVAIVGWLLVSRTHTLAEQRVLVFATLLLIGGAADYLSVSALLSGLLAGMCWRLTDGLARDALQRDVTYVQHSGLVVVLLLAGAHAEFPPAAFVLSAVYIATRTAAKFGYGWLIAPPAVTLAGGPVARLVAPGILGVAFAINIVRSEGAAFAPALGVVVAGTIASWLMSVSLAHEAKPA